MAHMYYLHSRKANQKTIPEKYSLPCYSSTWTCNSRSLWPILNSLILRSQIHSIYQLLKSSHTRSKNFFLKRKSNTLIQSQHEVERSTGLQILKFQADRGGEFTSLEFIDYCKKNGIHCAQNQAGIPQQNGIVERRNQFLLNMTRCITTNKGLSPSLWAEAIGTAAYSQNWLQSRLYCISVPISVIISYMLRKFYSPAKYNR